MIIDAETKTIITERLILRRFELADAEAVHKNWASDERVQSLYSEPVYATIEEVTDLLGKYIDSYEKPNYYRWAIIDKNTQQCIGQIAYFL